MTLAHSGQEAVIPTETPHDPAVSDLLEPPWYDTTDPVAVMEWARDYIVKDIEGVADDLRSSADFMDGKASLLFDMMSSVIARAKATGETT